MKTGHAVLDWRRADYYFLLCVGRWLAGKHPEIVAPEQWDSTLAVECLTMITKLLRGKRHYGRPLKPATNVQNYTAVRTFLADLQQWGVIPPRFDPYRSLTPPPCI